MKHLIALILIIGFTIPAIGAVLTVQTNAQVTNDFNAICEIERIRHNPPLRTITDDQCAQILWNQIFFSKQQNIIKNKENQSAKNTINSSFNAFKNNLVEPPGLDKVICGDNIIDTEFGETCDDGNIINGDGCNENCEVE